MENNNKTFTYTYSAEEQEELRQIREKYEPRPENKMEQLRRLDKSAEKPGTIASIALGSAGLLLLGVGMCCVLVWTWLFALGVVIGIIGIVAMALALPVFQWLTKREREKLAPEILRLSAELMEGK